ncbi:hypothetical protein ACFUTY_28905 [Streptomyces sp. NPDC057362]|uniref:hypothetical protein n=1 Tax=Streptomyces sp. NPDC057362 TaxID=3346106 RepID=UPI0036396D6C
MQELIIRVSGARAMLGNLREPSESRLLVPYTFRLDCTAAGLSGTLSAITAALVTGKTRAVETFADLS